MLNQQEIDKLIQDILRERQLIPPGMRLGMVELMRYRAVFEAGFEAGKEADNDTL